MAYALITFDHFTPEDRRVRPLQARVRWLVERVLLGMDGHDPEQGLQERHFCRLSIGQRFFPSSLWM